MTETKYRVESETGEVLAYEEYCGKDDLFHPNQWIWYPAGVPDNMAMITLGTYPHPGIRLQFIGKSIDGIELWYGDNVRWDDGSGGKYWRVATIEKDAESGLPIFAIDISRCINCKPMSDFKLGNFAYWPNTNAFNNVFEVIPPTHDTDEKGGGK